MAKRKLTLSFDLVVAVKEREGYFAASTTPFAITVYGDTGEEAEKRALQATILLLDKYSKTVKELSEYLNRMGVKHVLHTEGIPEHRNTIVRESRQEVRVRAPAHA